MVHRPSVGALECLSCGNKDRFVEVMAYETHLVDAHRNYIRLLDADVDSYLCAACAERIDPKPAVTQHDSLAHR